MASPRKNIVNFRRGGLKSSPAKRQQKQIVKTVVLNEHVFEHEFLINDSGHFKLDLMSFIPSEKIKLVKKFTISASVSSKVVIGDKYAGSIAFGLRLTDEDPNDVESVLSLPSSFNVTIPCVGQVSKTLSAPAKNVCDISDDDSDLFLVGFAETDKLEGVVGPLAKVKFAFSILYEPNEASASQWV